jgi:DNA-binding IclR family transcriptional regulator
MLLEALSDGRWHGVQELQLRLELDEQKFKNITAFLNKYNFVEVDEEKGKVKINRDFRELLAKAPA